MQAKSGKSYIPKKETIIKHFEISKLRFNFILTHNDEIRNNLVKNCFINNFKDLLG